MAAVTVPWWRGRSRSRGNLVERRWKEGSDRRPWSPRVQPPTAGNYRSSICHRQSQLSLSLSGEKPTIRRKGLYTTDLTFADGVVFSRHPPWPAICFAFPAYETWTDPLRVKIVNRSVNPRRSQSTTIFVHLSNSRRLAAELPCSWNSSSECPSLSPSQMFLNSLWMLLIVEGSGDEFWITFLTTVFWEPSDAKSIHLFWWFTLIGWFRFAASTRSLRRIDQCLLSVSLPENF